MFIYQGWFTYFFIYLCPQRPALLDSSRRIGNGFLVSSIIWSLCYTSILDSYLVVDFSVFCVEKKGCILCLWNDDYQCGRKYFLMIHCHGYTSMIKVVKKTIFQCWMHRHTCMWYNKTKEKSALLKINSFSVWPVPSALCDYCWWNVCLQVTSWLDVAFGTEARSCQKRKDPACCNMLSPEEVNLYQLYTLLNIMNFSRIILSTNQNVFLFI